MYLGLATSRSLGCGLLSAAVVCALPLSSAGAARFLLDAKTEASAHGKHKGLFRPNHPRVAELNAHFSHGHQEDSGGAIALTLARAVASLESSHGIRLDTDIMVSKQPFQGPGDPHALSTALKVERDLAAMTGARRRVAWLLRGRRHKDVRKLLRFLIDSSIREVGRDLAASERGEGHRLFDPAPLASLGLEMTRRAWDTTHVVTSTWGGFLRDLFDNLAGQGQQGPENGPLLR